jgi:hypothetical protein
MMPISLSHKRIGIIRSESLHLEVETFSIMTLAMKEVPDVA